MKEKEIRKLFNVKRTKHGLEDRISVSSGWTFPFDKSKLPEGFKTAKAIHVLTKLPVHFSGNNFSQLIK